MPIPETENKKSKMSNKMNRVYELSTFCEPGNPIKHVGAFRDNIRHFLEECFVIQDYTVDSLSIWSTFLVKDDKGSVVVPLYIIPVNVQLSDQPFCDHCRFSGWSHHYLSNRKYHVIIPIDSEWNKRLENDIFTVQTHLLHGLIHCNGYGHLLCINGIEGGSRFLKGREIMDLWDRICSNLHTRKITVEDTSSKRSMDLRLIHGIAYGQPWFGKWGYKFFHGRFGVQAHHYKKAVEILSLINLDDLLLTLQGKNSDIKRVISSYLDLSKTRLNTLTDLLKFMLDFKSKTVKSVDRKSDFDSVKSSEARVTKRRIPLNKTKPTPKILRRFSSVVATMDSRWPKKRLEYAADIIVDALIEHSDISKSSLAGMTRQEVRDAARLHIGDTGLLDYVLKSMNNVIVKNYVVIRQTNRISKILEYRIFKLGEKSSSGNTTKPQPVGRNVYRDLNVLYNDFLLNQPVEESYGLAVRVIRDSKHLVKEWPFNDENDQYLQFICRVLPTALDLDLDTDIESYKKNSNEELIVLPLHASIGDLKITAENAFKDTYSMMQNYHVIEIVGFEDLFDEEVVFGLIESGSEIWVRGSGLDLKSEFRFEVGPDNWTVKCSCGAIDDDGERMVSCDVCEVWQHTRCSGIEDSDSVPPLFICQLCCSSLIVNNSENRLFLGYQENETENPLFVGYQDTMVM